MLNVNNPWNVFVFGEAMKFAAGDIDEFKSFIPDLTVYAIDFS